MIYIESLRLPSEAAETNFISFEHRTCFNTFYPFKIFPQKHLNDVTFDGVTMFYGGNGSGKSTLLNIIARLSGATRFSKFNDAPFFDRFCDLCKLKYSRKPDECYVLTSDDVFDFVLSARSINEKIDEKRNRLFEKYVSVHNEVFINPDIGRLHGLDDYDRWKETREILSTHKTQSAYIKNRIKRDVDLYSNGETALRYFIDKIDGEAVYLLDEPENSLSIEYQIELAEYISATARATRSQFIIATHSPILLSLNNAKIYDLDAYPAGVRNWTELHNVRKYFDFFMSHKKEFENT